MTVISKFTKLRILQFCINENKLWTEILEFTGKAKTTMSDNLLDLQRLNLLKKVKYQYATTTKGKKYLEITIQEVKNELALLRENLK